MQRKEKRAPRFRAYVAHAHRGIFMRRSVWEKLSDHEGEIVEFDLARTPLAAIGTDARIVASFIEDRSEDRSKLTIFRLDPKDHPKELNLDRYEAGTIDSIIDFGSAVTSADTDNDEAMMSFVKDYVLIVPATKGEDHHLEDLPKKYAAVLEADQPSA